MDDTIIAVSSPAGNSLKGIVRLSGPRALTLVQNAIDKPINRKTWSSVVCALTIRLSPQHTLNNAKRSTLYAPRFCRIPVTLYLMPAPYSYTREDVVEIHTFGSKVLLEGILKYFIRAGACLAQPGEFTKRAFLNGRISLSQSEAVMNIIHSSTEREHRLAVNQLHQHSFRRLQEIHQQLLDLASRLELALDFSDQDIAIITPKQITGSLNRIISAINKTLKESSGYSATTDGITCVLCGRPNTGKSSLFNRLVTSRKNIVSPVPGTTRDYIEDKFIHKNTAFRLFDTAGISRRERHQTKQTLQQADIYLMIIDGSQGIVKLDQAILKRLNPAKTILVINKTDLLSKNSTLRIPHSAFYKCSARTGSGIPALKNILVERVKAAPPERSSDQALINLRQQATLKSCLGYLNQAIKPANFPPAQIHSPKGRGPGEGDSYEIIALDLKDALEQLNLALGSFSTGKNIAPDNILNNIFSRFCVGK
ncbi:MAG TPA: tRNA uridine-5-carboxymethylaminomethyl(34) synthesis GTPase MnmE [Planctomycetota bacterium]|nr:tRNA uridine-5-carboxymethylaminomethyl(34) synthesis GTPase MnmE [Planctomycetota bacterium]